MNVLIAVDDTEASIDAVHLAYRVFGDEAAYTVATIGEQTPIASIPPTGLGLAPSYLAVADYAENAKKWAHETARAATGELPESTVVETEVGAVGRAICRMAEANASDVVVIGSHDRGIWDRLFRPSTGKYVVENAPCSVLVVR